ncbi:cellulose biosynthesis protein BcsN [Agrobacterium sp. OT33]|uniref:cellulose biosynthesis protein BcsN n=1 Tax=Agrobacterium sp. OT33 TaxID=2815338 RepID=UPI001FEE6EAB|nr:cellulose biosynthesis protein BcsN [Agrobacterium sp. OT33]
MLSPSEALIFPPPGGPEIVTVVSRTYSNAVAQQVILRSEAATPGQNYIKAEFFGPQQAGDTDRDALTFTGFRSASVAREIRAEFPGENIAMSANYLQNGYGAFSYAAGNGRGDDTCLYGWQDIRSPESMRQDFRNLGRIKVRLRLCQSGASVDRLLAVMYNYTITGTYASQSWNPYGTPQAVDKNLGRPGHPVYPVRADDVPMRPGGEVTASVPARPARRVAAVAPVQPEPQPLPPVASVSIPSPASAGAPAQPARPAVAGRRGEGDPAESGPQSSQVSIPSPACLTGAGTAPGCR